MYIKEAHDCTHLSLCCHSAEQMTHQSFNDFSDFTDRMKILVGIVFQ